MNDTPPNDAPAYGALPSRLVEHVPGLVVANLDKRSGIPLIEGCHYSVADVLAYLGGSMSREELLETTGLDADALRDILRWVASVVNEHGTPKPAALPGLLRRRAQDVGRAWQTMLNQPVNSVQYRAATRLHEVAPDLATSIERLLPYL